MANYEVREMAYNFDKDREPVLTVQPGDTVTFHTADCFGNQITREDQLIDSVDFNNVNPGTGPVYIEGAQPGDVLVVDIDDIQIDDVGIALTYDVGPLKEHSEIRTKVVEIVDDKAIFNDVEIPIRPMIGVIGVAPAGEPVACGIPGESHGGNMDSPVIKKGSKVYLPVQVEGALLQIGDLHGVMGDAELSGAGLEIKGSATVTLDLIKNFKLNRPAVETEDRWYTIATGETYTETLEKATKGMQDLIVDAYGWDGTDAYIYMSLDGHVETNQACDLEAMRMCLRVGVPKIEGRELIK